MGSPYPHIACCLDESDGSARALAEARRLRALGPGRLSLVHVLETPVPGTVLPEAMAALTETPEGSLRWLGELARAGDYEYPVVLDHRFPPKAVCEWAAEVGPTCSWPRPSAGPASACSTAPSRATSRTTPPAPSSWSTS
jgi:Universal stress protein family